MAGLWEIWNSADGSQILSTSIITTQPNELIARIHNRMPVILPEATYAPWLAQGDQPPPKMDPFLCPYPAEEMEAFAVSRMVNSPANDRPECINPI